MTDEEFIVSFESCTLPKEQWRHREHVRMAWIYLKTYSFSEALERARVGIQRYNHCTGVARGYRETETCFFMRYIASRISESGAGSFEEFCCSAPELFDGANAPRKRFYSDELWRSPGTWDSFVEPDLQPLPCVPERADS
jgi:hypothetical protein